MIQELVYTSAPKGLKPGSGGFCTVASTPGMAAPLARFLTVQSRYRHLIAPGSPGAESNPVNYSNVKSKVGGGDFYVLSRVADAGLDYSNRSNMIAHHFAIDDVRSLGCGPASILKKEGQFFCEWKKDPTKLDPRKLSGIASEAKPCGQWKSVTGDAGWAGDVIEAFKKKTLVYLIINPSIHALDLVNEMLSLLPVEQQWDFTFSTFYTKGPSNVDCGIRFIIAGSPEVAVARRSKANLVLDLTKPLGQSQSKFADNARNGKMLFENKQTIREIPKLKKKKSAENVEKPSDDLLLVGRTNGLELDDDPPALPPIKSKDKKIQEPPKLRKPRDKEIVVTERDSKLGVIVFAAVLIFLLIGLGAAFPFLNSPTEVAEGGSEKKTVTEQREKTGAGGKENPKPDADDAGTQNGSERDSSNSALDDTSDGAKPVQDEINDKEDGENQPGARDRPKSKEASRGERGSDKKPSGGKPPKPTMSERQDNTNLALTASKRRDELVHEDKVQAIGIIEIKTDIELETIFDNLKLKLSEQSFEIASEPDSRKFPIKSEGLGSAIGFLVFEKLEAENSFAIKYEYNKKGFGITAEPYEDLNSSVLTISLYGKEDKLDLSKLAPKVKEIAIGKSIKAFKSRTLWEDAESEVKFRSTDSNDQKHAIYVGDASSGKYRLTFEINYEIRNNSGLPSVLKYELKSIKFGDAEFGLGKKGKKINGSPIPDGVVNRFLNEQIFKRRTTLNQEIKNIDPKQQGDGKLKTRLKGELADLENFKSQLKKGIMFVGEEDFLELVSEEANIIYKIRVKYDLEKFSLLEQLQGPKGQGMQNTVSPY